MCPIVSILYSTTIGSSCHSDDAQISGGLVDSQGLPATAQEEAQLADGTPQSSRKMTCRCGQQQGSICALGQGAGRAAKGASGLRALLMLRMTVGDSGVALLKELRYRSAKVSVTGSTRSITVASSCTQGIPG